MVYEITDQNFEREVQQSSVPFVLGFTAGFCTMCDELAPVFETLSDTFGDSVKFGIVNTDTEKALRITFAVASWPYVVYISNGQRTPLFDEAVTENRLEERIRYVMDGGNAPTFPIKFRNL